MKNEKLKPNVRELALKHGFSFPSDDELIMIILGSGTKEMPVEFLAKKVSDILEISDDSETVKNLLSIKGMGQSKALAIAAALELGRRKYRYKEAVIKKPSDIIPFISFKFYRLEVIPFSIFRKFIKSKYINPRV